MRSISITIAFAALLLTGAANAAGGSDKDPGKGATGPSAAPVDNSPGGGKVDSQLSELSDARGTDTRVTAKPWEIGAGIEYHHILDPEAIDTASIRNLAYYSLSARWDLTPYDRLSVRWGLYQTGLIDANDSPVRSDDIVATYTRRIPLPGKVTLRASLGLTAPVSYASQLATLVTSPRVALQLDRRFGHFSLDGRIAGTTFIFRDTTGGGYSVTGIAGNGGPTGVGGNGGGANPNPIGSLTMVISGDFSMPFHEPLSVGLSVYNGYSWVGNVGCSGASSAYQGSQSAFGQAMNTCQPTTNAAQPQPFLQAWGGEVYIRYALPTFGGFKSDLAATYAPNGDPTIGYASVTHATGEFQSTPFYYRQYSEMYFSVTGRY